MLKIILSEKNLLIQFLKLYEKIIVTKFLVQSISTTLAISSKYLKLKQKRFKL